jgi:hypothetical protein
MPTKYTLQRVQEIFKENECELISDEYEHNKKVLEFRCKCDQIIQMTFKKYLVFFHAKSVTVKH